MVFTMNLIFELNSVNSHRLSNVKTKGVHLSGTPLFQFPTTCQLVHILSCDLQSRNQESNAQITAKIPKITIPSSVLTGITKVRITVSAPIIEITHTNSFRTITRALHYRQSR